MRLNKIKLQNIRSYLSEEIEFPEGSVLLSGDIGSGKSTILLAIDFALFGLRKGSLSGGSLLRNGKNVGGVELYFEIDGKNVVVVEWASKIEDRLPKKRIDVTIKAVNEYTRRITIERN